MALLAQNEHRYRGLMRFPYGIYNPSPKKSGQNIGQVTLLSLVGEQMRSLVVISELLFFKLKILQLLILIILF